MSPTILPSASQFIEERKYLKNVTSKTLSWYQQAFGAFSGCSSEAEYKARVVQLRQRGLAATSVNTWLRVINAYLKWAKADYRLPRLKEDRKILETFSPDQVRLLLTSKQKSLNNQRAQCLAGLLLDTGLRIAEALDLRVVDVDFNSLLILVMGKGRKERRVPMSLEGRRRLYTWCKGKEPIAYVFATRGGSPLSIRNSQRDLRTLCNRCGIDVVRTSPHTLRHTFAVNYLRSGGNLEYLRRILGHSSILITQRYLASLTPEDLTAVHAKLSPLVGI